MTTEPRPNESTCDVLVVGSGAAGLATAIAATDLGLDVLVVEKAPVFGGTTARSGGWLWVPGNALAAAAGADDSFARARRYIAHEAGAGFDAPRTDAFLQAAGPMVDYFQSRTRVKFNFGLNYPDYHPDHPGAVEQGRSIHPQPFDGASMGPLLAKLALPMPESTFLGMGLNSGPDLKHFLDATRSLRSAAFVARRIVEHAASVLRHGRGTRLVNGNALAARLLMSAHDRGIALWPDAPAVSLLRENGRVVGAVVERDGRPVRLLARRGVVLAAGGFPHDAARLARHVPHLAAGGGHATLTPPTNTGDGVRLAETAHARVIDGYPHAAAWAPVSLIRYRDGREGRFFHLVDRAKPGVIAVGHDGRRFVNESENYHDFVAAMIRATPAGEPVQAFIVCDHRALRRYGLGAVRPFPLPFGRHLRSGYLKRGRTLAELAGQLGLDAATLTDTVERFNHDAARGVDTGFGKGTTSYQRLLGDPAFAPNPCLAPLAQAPFYAVRMVPGDLGTYHGLATDPTTRVLDTQGAPIAGLFAVGNDAASLFGGSYPGAGATLGPAMTFAYVCAHVLAGREPPGAPTTPATPRAEPVTSPR